MAPSELVMVAVPAVLRSVNLSSPGMRPRKRPLLEMVASDPPAVACCENQTSPPSVLKMWPLSRLVRSLKKTAPAALLIVAVPPLLKVLNVTIPPPARMLLIVAFPAVLLLKNDVEPPSLLIVAFAAEASLRNSRAPEFWLVIWIELAVVEFRKTVVPPSLVIDVMPDVSELTTLSVPRLVTSPTSPPGVVIVPS